MKLSYDPVKRATTLAERGLDFEDAAIVLNGRQFTVEDLRFTYPERRFLTFGLLGERMLAVVWTQAADECRIISMRKANDREQKRYRQHLG